MKQLIGADTLEQQESGVICLDLLARQTKQPRTLNLNSKIQLPVELEGCSQVAHPEEEPNFAAHSRLHLPLELSQSQVWLQLEHEVAS